MQGKKNYSEKLFVSFQLSDRVPKENVYRRLSEALDLQFLYKDTRQLYGKTGNPSIYPVVFFKLMLTGYLENIFGSLTQYYGLNKVPVLGIEGAHKTMLMAAIAFNIKKYIKYHTKKVAKKMPFIRPRLPLRAIGKIQLSSVCRIGFSLR